MRGQSRETQF